VIDEEILLAGHEKFRLAGKARPSGMAGRPWIDVRDVMEEPYLLYSVDHRLRRFTEMLFMKNKCEPQTVQYHDSFETIIRLAEVGMGLTFLPETYIGRQSALTYFAIGEQGECRTLALGFPPYGYISKATRAFADIVMEAVRDQKRD